MRIEPLLILICVVGRFAFAEEKMLSSLESLSKGFKIELSAIGDLNGDGIPDIVLRWMNKS